MAACPVGLGYCPAHSTFLFVQLSEPADCTVNWGSATTGVTSQKVNRFAFLVIGRNLVLHIQKCTIHRCHLRQRTEAGGPARATRPTISAAHRICYMVTVQ